MLFNIIMPSYHTILVGCRHFGVGSDLSAIASGGETVYGQNAKGKRPPRRLPVL